MKITTGDQILGRLNDLSKHYFSEIRNHTLTNKRKHEIRVEMEVISYQFIYSFLPELSEAKSESEIELDKTSNTAYERLYAELIGKAVSQSVAKDRANKLYKSEDDYIEAKRKHNKAVAAYWRADKLMSKVEGITNTMGKII